MRGDFASSAPITTLLLMINFGFYIYAGIVSKDFGNLNNDVLRQLGGSWPVGLWENEWLRLIAPNVLHGNLLHILFNSLTLFYFGPRAEITFGSTNFFSLYMLSGVAGFCCSQLIGGDMSIGASAALFGLMGADLAVTILRQPILRNVWRVREVRVCFFGMLFYIALGFTGVFFIRMDNSAHIGGAAVGLVFGALFYVWERRRRIHPLLPVGALLLVAVLVVAARWPVFNPYYHVHMYALALSDKRFGDAQRHEDDAREWARRRGNLPSVNYMLAAMKDGQITLDLVRIKGYPKR